MTSRGLAASRRGMTLIEVLVAIVVLTLISVVIFGAFSSLRETQRSLAAITSRTHEARQAMARVVRELESAYVSKNVPTEPTAELVTQSAFVGKRGTPADTLHFTSFSHRRLERDAHESDQAELSYFGAPSPEDRSLTDLVRRRDPLIDLEPERGGRAEVLAHDIDLFQLEYLDPLTGDWKDTWDTTQAAGEFERLPLQVRVTLVLNGAARSGRGRAPQPIRLVTVVDLPIHSPLQYRDR